MSETSENDSEKVSTPLERTILHDNPWLQLIEVKKPDIGINGYVFSHEKRCNGQIVAILPWRKCGRHNKSVEYMVREEVTPCWGLQRIRSSITGGVDDGHTPPQAAIIELREEAGYHHLIEKHLVSLGVARASKSSDTVYHLFAVNVTDEKQAEASGDGSQLDIEGSVHWVGKPYWYDDPHLSVMYTRLQELIQKEMVGT